MTLFEATFFTGLFCLCLGLMFFFSPQVWEKGVKKFSRSRLMALLTFGTAAVWFLGEVMALSEADFGPYKSILTFVFGGAGIAAFYYIPDFLAVRGLAGLILLSASFFLDAAYRQPQVSRLVLVSGVYLGILLAFYLGAYPYRFRDFANWLYEKRPRARVFGLAFCLYGVLLGVFAFSY